MDNVFQQILFPTYGLSALISIFLFLKLNSSLNYNKKYISIVIVSGLLISLPFIVIIFLPGLLKYLSVYFVVPFLYYTFYPLVAVFTKLYLWIYSCFFIFIIMVGIGLLRYGIYQKDFIFKIEDIERIGSNTATIAGISAFTIKMYDNWKSGELKSKPLQSATDAASAAFIVTLLISLIFLIFESIINLYLLCYYFLVMITVSKDINQKRIAKQLFLLNGIYFMFPFSIFISITSGLSAIWYFSANSNKAVSGMMMIVIISISIIAAIYFKKLKNNIIKNNIKKNSDNIENRRKTLILKRENIDKINKQIENIERAISVSEIEINNLEREIKYLDINLLSFSEEIITQKNKEYKENIKKYIKIIKGYKENIKKLKNRYT